MRTSSLFNYKFVKIKDLPQKIRNTKGHGISIWFYQHLLCQALKAQRQKHIRQSTSLYIQLLTVNEEKFSVAGKFCSKLNRNQDGAHSPLQPSDTESDITQKGGGMWRSKLGVAEKKRYPLFFSDRIFPIVGDAAMATGRTTSSGLS